MRRDYVHYLNQAASGEESSEVRHLFAYGTLRPDDVKGAPWTKRFREGMVWQRARVPSARLFADRYPFVVLSPPGQEETTKTTMKHADYVVGYVMCCDDQASFQAKLEEADEIEGHPHYYQRSVVEAIIEDDQEDVVVDHRPEPATGEKKKVKCFIYHRQASLSAYPVWCGDWAFVGLQYPTTPTDRFFQTNADRTTKTK
jgi:gamma-glutamylcyclotransferase (GGCT)/AIG2-like uncharacterized protein YtfP